MGFSRSSRGLKNLLARTGISGAGAQPATRADLDNGFARFRNCKVLVEDERIHPYIKESIVTGYYEDKEIEIVLRNIEARDTVLELGASLGIMSTVTCATSAPRAYTAVEANRDLIEIIQKNHAENNVKCDILYAAVSDAPGEAEFYIHQQCWASSVTPFDDPLRVDTIPTFSLQTLLDKTGANFLICDIEGGEYPVFEGSPELSTVDKICLELHPASLERMRNCLTLSFSRALPASRSHRRNPSNMYIFFRSLTMV